MPAILREKDVYFPVAGDAAKFASGIYKGRPFVRALPDTERRKIEALKPYKGGDDVLFTLHDLDVMRKHRKLIDVRREPTGVTMSAVVYIHGIEFVPIWPGFKNDAVIATVRKSARDSDIQIAVDVFFDEGLTTLDNPVLEVLSGFLSRADCIIQLFD
jgi:hypothetical protein